MTFLPLALSYLLCFPLQPCFVYPDLCGSSGRVVVHSALLAKKHYLVFTPGLTAEPQGTLTFFSLSPPCRRDPATPADTCAFVLPPTTPPLPPSTHWWGLVGAPCLWLCQMSAHSPLFYLTTQLGPDNDRKRTISILFNASFLNSNSWDLLKESLYNSSGLLHKLITAWLTVSELLLMLVRMEMDCEMPLTGVCGTLCKNLSSQNKLQLILCKDAVAHVGKPYGTDCPASSFAPMCHSMYIFLFMTLSEATLNVSWLSK